MIYDIGRPPRIESSTIATVHFMGGAFVKVCSSCKRIFVSERDYLKNTTGWRLSDDDKLYFSCSCKNVISLDAGSHGWYSPSRQMSSKAGHLFERLKGGSGLPRVSSVSSQLIEMLGTDTSTTIEMARLLKQDPVLAASVLKSASASRGISETQPVQSLEQAINYIGRKPLAAIVAGASLSNFKFRTRMYSVRDYWRESYATGYVAEALTRRYALHLARDLAYLSGSLINLGKCVGAILVPDEVDRVFERVKRDGVPWERVEKELGATDHALLGEVGSVFWGLPTECLEPIVEHHVALPAKAPQRPDLKSICTFANQLAHLILGQPGRVDSEILASCEKMFKIPGEKGMARLAEEFAPIAERVQSDIEQIS